MQGLSHLKIVPPEVLERKNSLNEDRESPRKTHHQGHSHGSPPNSNSAVVGVDVSKTEEEIEKERQKYSDLVDAINDGKTEEVKKLVRECPNLVNWDDEAEGFTALMTAVAYEDNDEVAIELTKFLLEAGAPRNRADKRGNLALHWAARLGRLVLLDILTVDNSNLELRNGDGNTPLHLASRFGQLSCCQYFLERVGIEESKKLKERLENWKKENSRNNNSSQDTTMVKTEETETKNDKMDIENNTKIENEPNAEGESNNEEKKGMGDVNEKLNNGEHSTKSEKTKDTSAKRGEVEEKEGEQEEDEEDGEEKDKEPKRNPRRAARDKPVVKKEEKIKRKGKDGQPFSIPEEQMQDTVVPFPLLLHRNLKGETAFDLAAERLDVEGMRLEEADELIKNVREKIQKEFLKYSCFFKTLILHHSDCFGHVPVNEHDKDVWEAPGRLKAIIGALKGLEEEKYTFSSDFELASREMVEMAHSKEYINFVYKLSVEVQNSAPVPFTPRVQKEVGLLEDNQLKKPDLCDTSFSKGSLKAALRAVGAVCHAVDRVVKKLQRNSFCIVRPPGHHAGIDGLLEEASSCGFCIFNNVAIGALHALKKYKETVKRVAIVDFDVHHGNGTEEIVAKYNREHIGERSHIMFFSSHLFDGARPGSQYEFYPGSGQNNNLYGNIINVAMQPLWRRRGLSKHSRKSAPEKFYLDHHGRTEFRRIISERLLPALRAYEPDLILLSAGFDAGRRDVGNGRFMGRYCSGFNLQQQDFAWVTSQVSMIANMCCEGRVVSVLEGGYGRLNNGKTNSSGSKIDRSSLARNTCAHIIGLVDPQAELDPDSSESEISDADYDEQGRLASTDGERASTRGSRTRRKPKRFEAEIERSSRHRKSHAKGMMQEGIEATIKETKSSKKRSRKDSSESGEESSSGSSVSTKKPPEKKKKPKKKEKEKKEKKEKLSKKSSKSASKKGKEKEKIEKSEKSEEQKETNQLEKEEKKKKPAKKRKKEVTDEEKAEKLKRENKRKAALKYLQQVKKKFSKNPSVYRQFLLVMGEFKKGSLDVDDVVNKVKLMFHGDRNLIEGFNTFLPPGYSIEYDEEDIKKEKEKIPEKQLEAQNESVRQSLPVPVAGTVPAGPVVSQTAQGTGPMLMTGNIPVGPLANLPPILAPQQIPRLVQPQTEAQPSTQGENILPIDEKTGLPADWQKHTTPKEPGSNEIVVTYTAPNGVKINNVDELEAFVAQFSDAKWIGKCFEFDDLECLDSLQVFLFL